ncbi:MAG: hypothetical protein V3V14_01380 [Saprospiraceae bacterium]
MNNKEKHIINTIRSHREDIDLDSLWNNIANDIPKQEKRKDKFVWWFFGLFIMVSIATIFYYSNANRNTDAPSNKNIVVHQNNDNNTFLTQDSPKVLQDRINEIASVNNNNNTTNDTPSHQSTDNYKKSEINNFTGQSPINSLSNTPINNIKFDTRNDKITSDTKSNNSKDYSLVTVMSEQVNYSRKNSIEIATTYEQVIDDKPTTGGKLKETKIIIREDIIIKTLIPLTFDLLVANNKTHLKTPNIKLYRKNNLSTPHWALEINLGGSLINRNLSSTPEFKSEKMRRSQIESVKGGFQLNTGVKYSVNKKFDVFLGLQLVNIIEKSQFSTSYIITTEEEVTTSTTYLQNGNIIEEKSNITLNNIRNTSEIRANKLTLVSIPIEIRYRIIQNENYKVIIGLNTAYSIYQKYNGHTSTSFNMPAYNITNDNSNKFKNKGAITYGIGATIEKPLSKLLNARFGLNISTTNGINNENYLIDQQYNSLTFITGISRKF